MGHTHTHTHKRLLFYQNKAVDGSCQSVLVGRLQDLVDIDLFGVLTQIILDKTSLLFTEITINRFQIL